MAGELVPLVMIPRYTTFAGAETYRTIWMDVTAYSAVILNVWRAPLVGGSPTFAIGFEESTDQVIPSDCTVTPASTPDPGASDETQYVVTLKKRWFRVTVTLNAQTVATCWAVGFLEERES